MIEAQSSSESSQSPQNVAPVMTGELWVFFVVALVVKVIFLMTVRDSPFVTELTNDELQHWAEALSILSTGVVRPDAFYFAPLYPYLLAALFAIVGPNLGAALLVNTVLGAVNVALTYALALVTTNRRPVARMAAVCVLLFAPHYLYEVLLLKTTVATATSTAAVLILMAARRQQRCWPWLVAGLVFGSLALLRGNTIVALPMIAAALVVDHIGGRLPTKRMLLWVAGVAIGILPATAHNLVAASDLVLTTYQGGTQFWIGNHDGATGTYVALRPDRGLPGQERFDAVSLAEEAMRGPLFPSEVSAFWFRRGLDYVRAEPGSWLRLMTHKAALLVANAELVDVVHLGVFEDYEPQLRLAFLPFGVLVAFAVAGVWLRRRMWWWDLPLWAATAGSAVSVVLFFVLGRYRVSFAPLLAVLAGAGLDQLVTVVRARRWRDFAVAFTLVAVVSVVAFQRVPEDSPLVSYNTLGGLYLRRGQAVEARECFEKVVAAAPNSAGLRSNLAAALERLDEPCAAARHRQTVEAQRWGAATSSGDLVALVEYLKNADLLRADLARCPELAAEPVLASRMAAVALELDARQRRGLFTPKDDVRYLIDRALVAPIGS